MTYAPIVVFGFNRPDALKNTIASLLRNEEAKGLGPFRLRGWTTGWKSRRKGKK